MSVKVYIVHHSNSHNSDDHQWQRHIEEIKNLLPDKIICCCLEEQDAFYIFRNFFTNMTEYLEETDNYIDLIVPSNANYPEVPRIRIHESVGLFFHAAINYPSRLAKMIPAQEGFRSTLMLHWVSNFEKIYSCYNNNMTFHKCLMVDYLAKNHLLIDGIVTAHKVEHASYKWQWHNGDRLIDEDDFVLNSSPMTSAGELPASYHKAAMDIVTESRYQNGEFFFTEKTIKPISSLKPFLSLSCPGYHTKYLRDYFGFQLYDEIFDYSFDTENDINRRVDGIISNIFKFKHLFQVLGPLAIYKQLNNKLWYNYTQVYNRMLDHKFIVPDVLKFLMESNDWEIYGDNEQLITYMISMNWCQDNRKVVT